MSSWGLEISTGSASGFGGFGEGPCDATGVFWSLFDDEPLVVTLSGWADSDDDILTEKRCLVARD